MAVIAISSGAMGSVGVAAAETPSAPAFNPFKVVAKCLTSCFGSRPGDLLVKPVFETPGGTFVAVAPNPDAPNLDVPTAAPTVVQPVHGLPVSTPRLLELGEILSSGDFKKFREGFKGNLAKAESQADMLLQSENALERVRFSYLGEYYDPIREKQKAYQAARRLVIEVPPIPPASAAPPDEGVPSLSPASAAPPAWKVPYNPPPHVEPQRYLPPHEVLPEVPSASVPQHTPASHEVVMTGDRWIIEPPAGLGAAQIVPAPVVPAPASGGIQGKALALGTFAVVLGLPIAVVATLNEVGDELGRE